MLPQLDKQISSPDFTICKLCGSASGVPTYILGSANIYTCRECDFHYLDHLDPPPDTTPVVLSELQLRYIDNRLDSNAQVLTARMQLVQEFIDLNGRNCLDIGTGVGQFVQMLVDEGSLCEGIEPSGLRREFARKRFGLDLSSETLEEPFWQDRQSSFDLITLWDVLEHVNDPVATLKAAFALLKPGGFLFIETDNRDCSSYRLSRLVYRLTRGGSALFLPKFYRLAPYGHKQIFRPEQLYALAIRCGFELLAATPLGNESVTPEPLNYRPRGQIVLVARKL